MLYPHNTSQTAPAAPADVPLADPNPIEPRPDLEALYRNKLSESDRYARGAVAHVSIPHTTHGRRHR